MSEVEASATKSSAQYLTFGLGDDTYMLDILMVKEIFEYESLTSVPLVPDYIRGVLNLRGHVVPVIDLLSRFGGESIEVTKKTCIIIIEIETETGEDEVKEAFDLGVMVDMVNRVVELPEEQIEPPPSFGANIRTDFILGMGKVEDEFVILIDVSKVLSIEELQVIDAMGEESSLTGAVQETQ